MLKKNDARYSPHYAMTLRVKPTIGRLLEDVAKKTSMNKTSVLVMALRDLARKEGVTEREDEENKDDGND